MYGAQEKTRTSTAVKPLVPETSVSTNSTTWAGDVNYSDRFRYCNRILKTSHTVDLKLFNDLVPRRRLELPQPLSH